MQDEHYQDIFDHNNDIAEVHANNYRRGLMERAEIVNRFYT